MKKIIALAFILLTQASISFAQQKAVLTFAEAKQLADRGDARAQAIVAMHYQLGWQTEKNEMVAAQYAKASAEAGHPLGIYRLGNLLVSGINGQKDPQTGYKLQTASLEGLLKMLKASTPSDPYVATALGIMLFQGKVCPQDKINAVKAYKLAADQGFTPAAFNYIMAEIEGQGVPKNKQTFLHYFGKWKSAQNTFSLWECPHAHFRDKWCGSCLASIEELKQYPPAIKFYNDNKVAGDGIVNNIVSKYQPPQLDEEYWKGKITKETAVIVPKTKFSSASKWVEIIRAKVNTGEVIVEGRTNYRGMANFGSETKQWYEDMQDYSQNDVSSLGNGGLHSTIQYLMENGPEGVTIAPNTPLSSKNRIGIIEFPISLEIKITNNSSEELDVNRLGLYVKNNELIKEFLPSIICDPNHTTIKPPNKYALVFHNFGWDDVNVSRNAKISSWVIGTNWITEKNINFNSIISDAYLGSEFVNQDFNPGPHGGMEGVTCRVDLSPDSLTPVSFFDIDMSRNPVDFFTKIKGDTTLPSGRANVRSIFNFGRKIKSKEVVYANISFDFDKSAKVLLTPSIDINGGSYSGNDINVLYETPRYYYNPITTFTTNGNGDADTLGIQSEITASEQKDVISNNIICKPLIQSSSKVSVLERPPGFKLVHEELSADGTKKATIHMARTENRVEGFFQIVSSDERNVLFSAPFSFGNTTSEEVGLSFAISKNWNWASWLLQHGLEKRLYIAFPGRNQTVFTLSNLNANDNDSSARKEKSENEINQIGSDENGENLVLSFDDEVYLVPLASRLAVSLQETIKSLGTGIVSVLSYAKMSDSRVPLLIKPIQYGKKILLSNSHKITLVSSESKNKVSGIVWHSDYTISIKGQDKWQDWNLLSGTISTSDNINFDALINTLRSKSQTLLSKINEPRKPDGDMDARCQNGFAINIKNFALLVGTPGQTRGNQISDIPRQNGLMIEWYNLNKIEFWPFDTLTVTPFGGGVQFAEFSQFFSELAISPDRKMAVAAEKSGDILHLVDLENKKVLAAVVRSQSDSSKCTVVFEDGYYLSGDGLAQGIALSDGFNAMSVAQLEVKYNRPDIVLERLAAPKETVDEAKRLRQRLARRSDFKNLEGASLIDVPVVTLPTDTPSSTGVKNLKISYAATNSSGNLKELFVYNNGALVSKFPLLGKNGKPGLDAEGTVDLHLASGENKIQLCAVNEDGVPSNFAEKLVTCTSKPSARETYIVACGVSEYKDTNFNLRYSAKDAGDVAEALKKSAESRGFTPKVLTLKNGEVDSETVAKIRNFLASATADDEVFLFFAGHGLLDKDLNYHYARSDTDFSSTENIGIQFDELESLVDCIKPLKRTVLFDTCHSGEVEEESKADVRAMVAGQSVDSNEAAKVQSTKIATRGMKVNAIAPKVSHSELINLEKLFPDSRRAKGANILTSSSGSEFSMESDEWNNGLFTYSLIKALQDPATDENKDGYISFSEAAENVKKKVTQLSSGKQRPITRGVNREQDPMLVSFNPAKAESTAPQTAPAQSAPPAEKKDDKKSWWSFGS